MKFNFQNMLEQFTKWLEGALPGIIGGLIIFGIGWWLSNVLLKLIRRAMLRGHADTGVISFLCSLLKVLFRMIVILIAASQMGMNMGSVVAALGAAGVTLGLAMKDSLTNISGGAQIVFSHPFRGGDYIAVQDVEGTVERIEIMFTTLRTYDNKEVVIPNSKIINSVVTNYSALGTRRLDLNYLIGYDKDISEAKQILSDLARSNSKVLKEPEPQIVVGEHRVNGVQVGVKVWCNTGDYWSLYSEFQEQAKDAFAGAGYYRMQ